MRRWKLPRQSVALGRVLLISCAIGLVSPLVWVAVQYACSIGPYPSEAYPYPMYVFAAIMVATAVALARAAKRHPASPLALTAALLVGCLSFVVALCGETLCYWRHICMGGHMDHPPYLEADYVLDLAWPSAALLPTYLLWRLRHPLAAVWAGGACLVLSYRFLFGSLGGVNGGNVIHDSLEKFASVLLEHWPGT